MDQLTDTLPGQTPLHPDELADFIPAHLTLKRELNEWEFMNINEAIQSTFSIQKNHGISLILSFSRKSMLKCFVIPGNGLEGKNLVDASKGRNEYLKEMRLADQGDFSALLKFALSM